MRCRSSAPPAIRGTGRWSGWSATPACSRSAAARRRSCAPWWQAESLAASCRRPATAISKTAVRSGGPTSSARDQSSPLLPLHDEGDLALDRDLIADAMKHGIRVPHGEVDVDAREEVVHRLVLDVEASRKAIGRPAV